MIADETRTRKRDRLEIIFGILSLVRENGNSIKPTPLLRKSNVSPKSFSEYYSELVSKGFVKEVADAKGRRFVTLTDRGFRYLEKYRSILQFIDEFEL
ncbi:MAG: winged helix-turn-helix domain-containing protein [archaeon]